MEFEAFPKIPRLFRDITITEKIDGTNAAVLIEEWDGLIDDTPEDQLVRVDDGTVSQWYRVQAQSRKRLITPESDNFGFAAWVHEHAADLVRLLGPGRHFGEWWGSGIQRGYDCRKGERYFSLFNVDRYADVVNRDSKVVLPSLRLVPVLYRGPFHEMEVRRQVSRLAVGGSQAAPGFSRPEGVIVWHTAARQTFKVTVENDDAPKGSIHWGGDGI